MSSAQARPLRPPRALVFDLDGTLVDSLADIAAACNFALHALGRPPLEERVIRTFVGDGARVLLARALGAEPDSETVKSALEVFYPYYAVHAADHTRWMPGAVAALDALSGMPLTLSTNKPRAATETLLRALGAASRFAAVVAGGDGPLKPNPEAVRSALAPTGVPAEDAWVVGDGVQDIEAGRAAGAVTIGMRGGFNSDERLRAASPDAMVATLAELVALVEASRGGGPLPTPPPAEAARSPGRRSP